MDPFANQYEKSLIPQPTKGAGCSPMLGCVLVLGMLILGAAGAFLFLAQSGKSPVSSDAVSKLQKELEDKLKPLASPDSSGGETPKATTDPYDAGVAAKEQGDWAGALESFNQAINQDPARADAYVMRGDVNYHLGNFVQALADFETALALTPDDAEANNNYAWFLATCPEDILRDGGRAVDLATKACEASGWKDPGYLDTLAAAYAERGKFKDAVKYQKQAIDLLKQTNDDAGVEEYKDRLHLYRQEEPYRETVGK